MVEAVGAIVIVSVMIVAALRMIGALSRNRLLESEQARATGLAHLILAEAYQTNYEEPDQSVSFGTEPDELLAGHRQGFDDVDDYHSWTGGPTYRDGTAVSGYEGWSVSVNVSFADPLDPAVNSLIDTSLKRITVTVTGPVGKKATVVALRSKWGRTDQLPSDLTTYVSSATLRLRSSELGASTVISSTNALNQVP